MQHSTKIVKKAVSTLLDILKLQPFTAHTVKELMWGYEDPLLKLGKQGKFLLVGFLDFFNVAKILAN